MTGEGGRSTGRSVVPLGWPVVVVARQDPRPNHNARRGGGGGCHPRSYGRSHCPRRTQHPSRRQTPAREEHDEVSAEDLGRGGGGGLLGGAGCGEGKVMRQRVRRPRRLLPMARPHSAPSPLRASQKSLHPPSFVGPRRGCPPRCPPGQLSKIKGVFVLEIPPPKCAVKSSCFREATLTSTFRGRGWTG